MKKNKALIIISTLLCVTLIALGLSISKLADVHTLENTDKSSEVLANNSGTRIMKVEGNDYISYIVEDYERDLTYTWQFEKTDEFYNNVNENLEIDINLRLSLDAYNEATEDINNRVSQNKLIVTFDHHGKLPSNATVRVNVSDKFKDGEKLYLYYYNEETNQIEYIKHHLAVSDGYVEFNIDHCSNYFLTGAVVNDAVNNPKSVNYIIIGLGVIVFILIAITLSQSKNK